MKNKIKKALASKPEDVSDLDMMISLFQNQPEDNGYFVYLIGDNKKNPYDLRPKLDFVKPRILNQIQKKNAHDLIFDSICSHDARGRVVQTMKDKN